MPTDSVNSDTPLADPLSPAPFWPDESQAAQMAALTLQATAQVQALAASLRQADAQLAPPAPVVPPPVPDDALAALLASPGFQAQMAALTQQALAQVQALAAALKDIERQLALPSTVAAPEEMPAGVAVQPAGEPWVAPLMPIDAQPINQNSGGWGMKLLPPDMYPSDPYSPDPDPPGWMALARSAVIPPDASVSSSGFATDMLAALPAAPATIEPVAPVGIAFSAPAPETPVAWMLPDPHHAGAEGGNTA